MSARAALPAIAGALFALAAPLAALDLGEPAPSLDGVTWVKGEPAKAGAGSVAVVEFWATWCGPCRQSIPHLTKLQQAHPDVVFIGLSDEDRATVEPFVAKEADQMAYHVGVADAATKEAWMHGVPSIPHAYLVAADGHVVWQGHPLELDGPLGQVLAGTWDPQQAAALDALHVELRTMFQNEGGGEPDFAKAIELTAKMLALDPADELGLKARLALTKQTDDHDAYDKTLADLPVDRLPAERLNSIAWDLLTEQDLAWRALDRAVVLARAAAAKDPKSAAIADTWARALGELGMIDEAIAAERNAIALAKAAGDDDDALQAALDYFERAKQLRATVAGADAAKPAAPVDAPVP